jgi:hypothetical protein
MSLLRRALARLGTALEPLFDADAESRRRRDAKLMQLLGEHERTQQALRAQAERQQEELARLRARLESVGEQQLPQLRDAMRQVRASVTRQERIVKRSRHIDRQYAEAEHVLRRLDRLARSDRPLLVGPWTGEVGFELLYWIPFVRWAAAEYHLKPQRITVLSRGGPRAWYDGLHARYIDSLDIVSVDEFREQTSADKKQRLLRQFDRALLRRARAEAAQGAAGVLHPGIMYSLFMPYWKRQAPLQRVLDHVAFARLGAAAGTPLPGLPPDYVAVRFYFSSCFPDTPTNRAFVTEAVAALAQEHDVVLLDPGVNIDDHRDSALTDHPRVHRLPGLASPSENLAVQTDVIRGARAFVGTYGGYAYLAPFYGVDAVAFYSEANYYVHHLELAQHALRRVGGGHLDVVDVAAVPILASALGRASGATTRGPRV